jgi:hypothetical protein
MKQSTYRHSVLKPIQDPGAFACDEALVVGLRILHGAFQGNLQLFNLPLKEAHEEARYQAIDHLILFDAAVLFVTEGEDNAPGLVEVLVNELPPVVDIVRRLRRLKD